jgi:hypothetical protein
MPAAIAKHVSAGTRIGRARVTGAMTNTWPPVTYFGCGAALAGYPVRMKLAAVTTTPETIPAY